MKATAAEPALFADGELADVPDNLLVEALAAFNEVVSAVNLEAKATIWRGAKFLNDARRKRMKIALQDYGGVRGFKEALVGVSRNAFLLGKEGRTATHRNWTPDLDFFIQPKTVVKILEGGYPASEERPKKLHIPMAYRTPAQAEEKPFVPEPPEVRLEALAASYHKVGRYKDEVRVLEQLAKLTGRPFVMTPAPDVTGLTIPPKEPEPPRRPPPIVTTIEPEWDDDIPLGAEHEAAE